MSATRVLTVDDESTVTEFVRLLLEREGFVVREENNGLRAVETIREFHPDAVLLDVKMPEIDGRELAEHILNDETLAPPAILFLTGTSFPEGISVAGQKRMVLKKPIVAAELVSGIRQQIAV